MPSWSMDDWQYLRSQHVDDPRGRRWTVALMDVLGQEGDPDRPDALLEMQYGSGRYFTLIYSPTGTVQWEQGYPALESATLAYDRLVSAVAEGRLDPAQPVFRENLEDG
jgi:hypothetical protein